MSKISLADRVLNKRFRDELDRILYQHNHKVHTRSDVIPRNCSTKTRHERRSNLRLAFAELHQLGFRMQSPLALKQKHLHALGAHWQQKQLAAKTIHGLFSTLRQFAEWVGKSNLVEDISVYCDGHEHLVRRNAATVDLSWEALGIDVDAVFATAKAIDTRLWILLRLQRYFGLRAKESIEFRPWRATALDDNHLHVTDGTKGGKYRIVPIRTERQREILKNAKEIVGDQLNAQIRWPDKTFRQAQAHFYHLMRKLDEIDDLRGATAHGLRHGFLQGEYEHYAGLPAPIKAAGVLPKSRIEHKRALLAVSLEAGHFRESATGMYCGSLGHQLREIPANTPVNQTGNHLEMMKKNSVPNFETCNGAKQIDRTYSIVPPEWVAINWVELISINKPDLKLVFESGDDWALYELIDCLAKATDVSFSDATRWVARHALAERFEAARQMASKRQSWDPDVLYVCRVLALQMCKSCGPDDPHDLGWVDWMIFPMLNTDDELQNYERAMSFIRY